MQVYPTARRSFAVAIISISLLSACGQQPYDPYAAQKQQLAYEQQQQSTQLAMHRAAFLEPFARTLLAAGLLAPVIGLLIGIDAWRLRRRLVAADHAGKLPLPRRVIEQQPAYAAAALGAFHATAYQAASPRTLAAPTAPTAPTLVSPAEAIQPALPSRVDLLAALRTFTPTPERLLMGQGATGPVYRSLEQLLHVGVLGSSGSGKSTSQLALACQLAMIPGATMAVLDPEAATFQALRTSPRLYLPFPEDGAACVDNLQALQGELNERRAILSAAGAWDYAEYNREHGASMGCIFSFIDELQTLTGYQDTENRLLDLARRGRKVGMYLVVASQSMKREDVGSTTIRQQFATKLLLRTGEAAQGRALGLEANWCKQATAFQDPGLAVYSPSDGMPEVIRVPYVGKAAAAHILRGATLTVPAVASPVTPQAIETLQAVDRAYIASESARSSGSTSIEQPDLAEIVRRLAASGVSQNKILESVYNVRAGGSRAYLEAREQYKAIVGEA